MKKIFSILCFLLLVYQANAADLHVGPGQTYSTVQAAVDAASPGDVIIIHAGTYREEVRIDVDGITIRANTGDEVIMNGCEAMLSWTNEGNGIYSTPMNWEVTEGNQANQVFVDGVMLFNARWPNRDGDHVMDFEEGIVDDAGNVKDLPAYDGIYYDAKSIDLEDADFSTEPNGATRWTGAKIFINLSQKFTFGRDGQGNTGEVMSISGSTITALGRGLRAGTGNWGITTGSRYYLFNPTPTAVANSGGVAALLDEGEWWKNPDNNTLYVKLPGSVAPSSSIAGSNLVEVKKRVFAFRPEVDGTFSDVTIKDLKLFGTSITTDDKYFGRADIAGAKNNVLDNLDVKYVMHTEDCTGDYQVQWNGISGIILSGRNNTLKNSHITQSAASAVSITGHANRLFNCEIHDVNYMVTESGAVNNGTRNSYSKDHDIGYNTIYNTPHAAISTRQIQNSDPRAKGVARIHHNYMYNCLDRAGDLGHTDHAGELGVWVRIDHNVMKDATSDLLDIGVYVDYGALYNQGEQCRPAQYIVDHNVVYNMSTPYQIQHGCEGIVINNVARSEPTNHANYVMGGYDAGANFNNVGMSGDNNATLTNTDFYNLFNDVPGGDFEPVSTATKLIDLGKDAGPWNDLLNGTPSIGAVDFGIETFPFGANTGLEKVADPVITPDGGTYDATKQVSISCATPGATIRYTTDGRTPTITWGEIYTGPFDVTESGKVMAIAYKDGMIESYLSISEFELINYRPADTPGDVVAGLDYKHYDANQYVYVPDTKLLLFDPSQTGYTDNFNISVSPVSNERLLAFEGYIDIQEPGEYTFYLNSEAAARLYIGNQLVCDNDFLHPEQEVSGTIGLEAGLQAILVEYLDYDEADVLDIQYSSSTIEKSAIPDTRLFRFDDSGTDYPPAVSILVPHFGAVLESGYPQDIVVEATDETSINKVELYRGTTLLDTDDTAPYEFSESFAAGSYTLKAVAHDNTGNTTEHAIPIEARDYTLANIEQTHATIMVDGSADAAYDAATSYSIANNNAGTVTDANDLSATFKAMYTMDNLYLLVNVTDNEISANYDVDQLYLNDGVEIFLDMDNQKKASYEDDDYHFNFSVNGNKTEYQGHNIDDVGFVVNAAGTSYVMEIRIPWSTIGNFDPDADDRIGFEIEVIDNDESAWQGKLAWWLTTTDDANSDPSTFGIARITDNVTDNTPPGVPTLFGPSDNETTNTQTPQFIWYSVSDPSGIKQYEIKIGGTTYNNGNDTLFTSPTLGNGTYSWQVRATDKDNNVGNWSAIRELTVNTSYNDNIAPPAPALVSPYDGKNIGYNNPVFTWSEVYDVAGIKRYEISLNGTIYPVGLNTSYQATAVPDGANSWKVRAVDNNDNDGAWSASYTLNLYGANNICLGKESFSSSVEGTLVPELGNDGDYETRWGSAWTVPTWWSVDLGQEYEINRIYIDWQKAHATAYEIQVGESIDGPWTTELSLTGPTGLVDYTLDTAGISITGQYIRMYATAKSSQYGVSFKEFEAYSGVVPPDATAPPAPALVSPADGYLTNDNTPQFQWTSVTDPESGISHYELEVGAQTFNAGNTTIYSTTSYLAEGTHNWKVRAVNGDGLAGNWSSSRTITIDLDDDVAPDAPSLVSPSNNATLTSNTVLLDWDPVTDPSGIIKYEVDLSGTIYDVSTATEYTTASLDDGSYTWKVRATDAANNLGDWSATRTFTVNSGAAGYIQYTTSAPTIDGSVDAAWVNTINDMNNVIYGTVSSDADLSGSWRAMWDDNNLYFLAEVNDDVHYDNSNSPWKDDGIELFIDIGNDKATSYGADDFQYGFRASGAGFTEYKHAATSNVSYSAVVNGGSYVVEVAIPWATLGATPSDNMLVGFEPVAVDDDLGGDTFDKKKAWTASSNDLHNDPSLFGTAQLTTGSLTKYTLTIESMSGTVTPESGTEYFEGTEVSVEVIHENLGFEFVQWEGDITTTSENPVMITMDADKTITAVYQGVGVFNLTTDDGGHGTITLDPDGGQYNDGTDVTVSISNVESGYTFTGWSDASTETSTSTTITMDADKSITANYAEASTYSLTVNSPSNGTITLEPAGGSYTAGDTVFVTALPDWGYKFDGWTGDASTLNFTAMVVMDGNKSLNASFSSYPVVAGQQRLRPRMGNGTLLSDRGTKLRGCYVYTDYIHYGDPNIMAGTKEGVFSMVNDYGFNAIRFFCGRNETPIGQYEEVSDSLVKWTREAGAYLMITIGTDPEGTFNPTRIQEMWDLYAPKYKDETHVIFEIKNEPEFNCNNPYATATREMEVTAYNNIRSHAPNTHLIMMSYAATSAEADYMISDLQYLKDNGVDFENASVGFHGYHWCSHARARADDCCPQSTEANIIPQLQDLGYSVLNTEFDKTNTFEGDPTTNGQLLKWYEDGLDISWISFYQFPNDNDNLVTPTFRTNTESIGVSWCPDFGTWPEDAATCHGATPPPPTTYLLTVENGSGDGNYEAGAERTITADNPASGYTFDVWTGQVGNVADVNASSTTITMPAAATTVTATYTPILVTSISIPEGNQTITVGNSFQFTKDVTPDDALDQSVTWEVTSGSAYASVDANGLVTALAVGTATITATANDGSNLSASVEVTVTDIPADGTISVFARMISGTTDKLELIIDNNPIHIWDIVGSSYQEYTYSGLSGTGNLELYFQDNGTDMRIDYIVINGSTTMQAEDQEINEATWQDGSCGGNYAETMYCPGSIIFGNVDFGSGTTPTTYTLATNVGTGGVDVTVNPDQASYDEDEEVTLTPNAQSGYSFSNWTGTETGSSNPLVINMNEDESITANFSPILVSSISIPEGNQSIEVNGTVDLSVNVSPGDALDPSVTWDVTSGSAYASVDANGLVTGLTAGTATITATANDGGGASESVEVTVTETGTEIDHTDPVGTGTITARAEIHSDEGKDKAFDNLYVSGSKNVDWSKWLDNGGTPSASNPSWIQIDLPSQVVVNKLVIISANDDYGRDPEDFQLKASNDASPDWGSATVLGSWNGEEFTSRFQSRDFAFTNSNLYNKYRLEVTKNDNDVSMTQLCEIMLIGPSSATPTTYTLATNVGTGGVDVTVNPDQASYDEDEQVTLTPNAQSGYSFSNWTGTETGSSNPLVINMTEDESITANFSPILVSSITIPEGNQSLEVGESVDLSVDITPNDALDPSVTWEVTSGSAYASVDANGLVTANAAGTATITATTNDGSNLSASVEVTVTNVPPPTTDAIPWVEDFTGLSDGTVSDNGTTGWTIDNTGINSAVGIHWIVSETLKAQNTDAEVDFMTNSIDISSASTVTIEIDLETSSTMDAGQDYSNWYYKVDGGSEQSIVEIDGAYTRNTVTITGVSGSSLEIIGRTYINAGNEQLYVYSISVTAESTPTTYALTVENGSGDGNYEAGAVQSITADNAASGYTFDAWTGDVTNVADINASSTTITMPAAATTVTATYTPILVSSISIPEGDQSLEVGETVDLSVDITPTDALDQSVTWEVTSGSSYASVDANGLVTALAAGTATIRAETNDGSNLSASVEVTVTDVVTLPNPLAWYKFDGDATDAAGSHDGTVQNSPSYSTDSKEGSNSISLVRSSSQWVNIDHNDFENPFSQLTVTGWIKANGTSNTQVIYEEGGAWKGLCLRLNNNQLEARAREDNQYNLDVSSSFTSTEWKHVAVVFDNGNIELFVDGSPVATNSTNNFTTVNNHSNAASIGGTTEDTYGSSGDYFDGLLDDIRVYEDALTDAQVDAVYDGDSKSAKKHTAISGLSNSSITVYPNPAGENSEFTVNVTGFGDETSAFMKIYDMTGRLVHAAQIHTKGVNVAKYNLSTTQLGGKGIYCIKITAGNKLVHAKLVIE